MTTQTLNTGSNAPVDGTTAPAGHDQQMAQKFDNQQQQVAPDAGTVDRPAWLDPKFATGEDLAKAYNELQKKFGNNNQQQPAPKPAAQQQQQGDARQVVENAGLDFDALSDEFASTGQLSAATYDALAARGIPRGTVDAHIAGQQALANEVRTSVFTAVGGEEAYVELVGWAKDNLKPGEIAAYNNAMNSGDVDAIRFAVDGLRARHASVNGSAPNLLGGGSGHNTNASGDQFRSLAEMKTAMADPRYAADPAYRNDVIAKLGRSNIM